MARGGSKKVKAGECIYLGMNPEARTPGYITKLARKLRLSMTKTELLLWEKLKGKQLNGFRFRKQHPVYRYVLDFYCAEARLAIEIDGEVHSGKEDYDEFRDGVLKSLSIETLRIQSSEIEDNIEAVLNRIKDKLISRSNIKN